MGLKFTRLVDKDVIPTKVSQLENDSNYQNEEQVDAKVNAITKENLGLDKVDNTSDMDKPISTLTQKALDLKANKNEIPTKTSQLTNDSNFLTEHQDISGKADKTEIPTKVSELENDSDFQSGEQVDGKISQIKIPTTLPASDVYEWAKQPTKPSYTKNEIGLGNVNNVAITQEEVTQIGTNKTNIEKTNKQVETNIQHISNAQSIANEALNIAKGRTRTKVFDTFGDMTNYLKSASKEEFKLGDNLLIKATNVPDYWISNILENNSGVYGYYEISILETQKVDLSNYYNKSEIDAKETNINNKINAKANASDVYDKNTIDTKEQALNDKIDTKANKSELFSKDYNDLTNKPTIPTTLPASDVYSWAKQPTKPTYTPSEVGLGNVRNVASYSQAESDEKYALKGESGGNVELPTNPEFESVRIKEEGNLVFENYNHGIEFEQSGSKIYQEPEEDRITLEVYNRPIWRTWDENGNNIDKPLATLDDIGTGGGSLPSDPKFDSITLEKTTLGYKTIISPHDIQTHTNYTYLDINAKENLFSIYDTLQNFSTHYGNTYIERRNKDGEIFKVYIPLRNDSLATTGDITSGKYLPADPTFNSIKAKHTPFIIYDFTNKEVISIGEPRDANAYNIGNNTYNLSLYGKREHLMYNGKNIPNDDDVYSIARGVISTRVFDKDDYDLLEIDFTNIETIENSFSNSNFVIDESDFESETPILKFSNDNTMNSKISFANIENSSLDLLKLELTYYIFFDGQSQSTILKDGIQVSKFTIEKLKFEEEGYEKHKGTLVVNHYKFAENLSKGLIYVEENTSQKIVFSGKIPANTLIRYDNYKQCWFVDFVSFGDLTTSDDIQEGGTKIQILTWEDDD